MGFLQMLHEDSHHHIDQNKLGQEDKNDEVERCNVLVDTAVAQAVLTVVTLFSQSILHDPVPVVS